MERKPRKQMMVDPLFQSRFILRFCIIVVTTSVLVGGGMYFFLGQSTTVAIENTKVFIKPTVDFILPNLFLTVLIVAVFSATVVFAMTLVISHRIAGPVFHLQREIMRMKEGDMIRDFKIRNTDELQVLADQLTLMTKIFRVKHAAMRQAHAALRRVLEEKNFVVSTDDRDGLKKLLDEMDSLLYYFKV